MIRWLSILLLWTFSAFAQYPPQAALSINATNGRILAPPGATGSNFANANGLVGTNSTSTNGTIPVVWNGQIIWVNTNSIVNTNSGGGGTATNAVANLNGSGTNTFLTNAVLTNVNAGGTFNGTFIGAIVPTNLLSPTNTELFSNTLVDNLLSKTNVTAMRLSLTMSNNVTNAISIVSTNDIHHQYVPAAKTNQLNIAYSSSGEIDIWSTNQNTNPDQVFFGRFAQPYDNLYELGLDPGAGSGPFQTVWYVNDQGIETNNGIVDFGGINATGAIDSAYGFGTPGGMIAAIGSFGTLEFNSAIGNAAGFTNVQAGATYLSNFKPAANGVTDDSAIVNLALVDAEAHGFRPLIWDTNEVACNIDFTTNGITIFGAVGGMNFLGNPSMLGNIIPLAVPFDHTKPVFRIGHDTNLISGIRLYNMTIEGTTASAVDCPAAVEFSGGAYDDWVYNSFLLNGSNTVNFLGTTNKQCTICGVNGGYIFNHTRPTTNGGTVGVWGSTIATGGEFAGKNGIGTVYVRNAEVGGDDSTHPCLIVSNAILNLDDVYVDGGAKTFQSLGGYPNFGRIIAFGSTTSDVDNRGSSYQRIWSDQSTDRMPPHFWWHTQPGVNGFQTPFNPGYALITSDGATNNDNSTFQGRNVGNQLLYADRVFLNGDTLLDNATAGSHVVISGALMGEGITGGATNVFLKDYENFRHATNLAKVAVDGWENGLFPNGTNTVTNANTVVGRGINVDLPPFDTNDFFYGFNFSLFTNAPNGAINEGEIGGPNIQLFLLATNVTVSQGTLTVSNGLSWTYLDGKSATFFSGSKSNAMLDSAGDFGVSGTLTSDGMIVTNIGSVLVGSNNPNTNGHLAIGSGSGAWTFSPGRSNAGTVKIQGPSWGQASYALDIADSNNVSLSIFDLTGGLSVGAGARSIGPGNISATNTIYANGLFASNSITCFGATFLDGTTLITASLGVTGLIGGTGVALTNFPGAYTNWNLNQVYTNASGNWLSVGVSCGLQEATVSGQTGIALYLSNSVAGGSAFAAAAILGTSGSLIAESNVMCLSGLISNNGAYYFTNVSTGVGNAASILASTGYNHSP